LIFRSHYTAREIEIPEGNAAQGGAALLPPCA